MSFPDSPPPSPRPSLLAGRLSILAAALLWSTSGLFAKAPLFADWSDTARGPLLAFWRAVFAATVLAVMVRRPRWRPGLVPLGLSFAGMNVTYLSAVTLTTAANAIWLQYMAPCWVFLLGLLVGQRIQRRDLVPLGFGTLGVGAILWFEVRGQAQTGVACGVASGVCFAGVVLAMRRLADEDAAWLATFAHAAAAIVLLPWVLHVNVWPTPTQLLVLALFGALQMGLPYVLLIRGLRAVSSQEAVALGLVEPVLMPLWVLLAWHETPAPWTIAGAGLILVGLVLRYAVLE